MRLSATRIKAYLQCPRQFRYGYIDEIPTPLTGPLAFGQVMHETINQLHLHSLQTGEPLDIHYGCQEFDRLWRDILEHEDPIFTSGKQTVQEYHRLAYKMLHGYVTAESFKAAPLVLEFPFELPWSNGSGEGQHLLTGIIDRVDEGKDGLIIVDYKTGQRKPKADDLNSDLQFTIYAFAVQQLFEQPVDQVVYYHLRDQTCLLTTRGESDYYQLLHEVLPHVLEVVEAEMFPAHYGFWCKFCNYRELCQAEGPDEHLPPAGEMSSTALLNLPEPPQILPQVPDLV